MGKKYQITAFTLAASAMQGCAYVPNFDVPNGKYNEPTAYPIAERVVCEVVEIVENRTTPTHAAFLWDGNYDVEASLSLDVNDTGGLAPSLSSIVPYSAAATSLVWGATATFSKSRDQNFTENIRFNVREAFKNWADQHKRAEKRGENLPPCPQKAADTNLSGDLGIKDIVALADSTSRSRYRAKTRRRERRLRWLRAIPGHEEPHRRRADLDVDSLQGSRRVGQPVQGEHRQTDDRIRPARLHSRRQATAKSGGV